MKPSKKLFLLTLLLVFTVQNSSDDQSLEELQRDLVYQKRKRVVFPQNVLSASQQNLHLEQRRLVSQLQFKEQIWVQRQRQFLAWLLRTRPQWKAQQKQCNRQQIYYLHDIESQKREKKEGYQRRVMQIQFQLKKEKRNCRKLFDQLKATMEQKDQSQHAMYLELKELEFKIKGINKDFQTKEEQKERRKRQANLQAVRIHPRN